MNAKRIPAMYSPRVRELVVAYCEDHTINEASGHFGIPYATIYNWINQTGKQDNFKRSPRAAPPKAKMDEAMAVLASKTPPNFPWTTQEIASVCGVSHQAIDQLINKALKSASRKIDTHFPEVRCRNHR